MSNEHKMGKQKLLLYFVFLCVIGASVDAMLGEEDGTHSTGHCVHEIDYINQVGLGTRLGTDSLYIEVAYCKISQQGYTD